MSGWQVALTLIALVAAAISGGAFFAFSNFVMPAFGRLPESEGAAAMQAVNVAAPSPTFVAAIVGAGLVAVPAAVAEVDRIDEAGGRLLALGAVLSIASFVVTVTLNVPRNDALDRVDARSEAGRGYWRRYLVTWTRANTARTVASLGSVAAYGAALATL
ncbi:MAG: anthrone oxygenase family protein [Actinomycetota bacterium]